MTCASPSSHDAVLAWQQSHAHLLLASYRSQTNKHNKRVSSVMHPHNRSPTTRITDSVYLHHLGIDLKPTAYLVPPSLVLAAVGMSVG